MKTKFKTATNNAKEFYQWAARPVYYTRIYCTCTNAVFCVYYLCCNTSIVSFRFSLTVLYSYFWKVGYLIFFPIFEDQNHKKVPDDRTKIRQNSEVAKEERKEK